MGAVSLGTVFVAINANIAGLVSGTQLAKAHLGHFGRQVGAVSPQLQRLGMSATIAGLALTAMSIGAVRHFARFEQEMANVGSVLGENFKSMTRMRSIAREWGQTSVFSAKETAQAMYYLASAGYDADETIEALGATLTLAGATMTDLSQITQMVVAAMNAFALGTENAERVANAYAAAISKSQATADRLAISMRYVAPIAHTAGQEFETVVAALGLLYNSGMEASMAGTALRMSLVRLARLTPMARRELERLGIAAEEVDPTLHSLVEIVRRFQEAEITPRAASVIFGARALAGILNLVTAGADSFQRMKEDVTGTNKAFEMLGIQTDSLFGILKKLKNALGEVVLQFGQALIPLLRTVVEGTREVTIAFGNLAPALKSIMSITAAVGGVLLTLGGVIAFIGAIIPKFVVGFAGVKSVMALLAGPLGILIGLGIVLVGVFWKIGKAVREARKSVSDSLKDDAASIESARQQINNLQRLAARYDELIAIEKKTAEETKELLEVMEKIRRIQPALITGVDEFGKAIDIDRERVKAYTDELIRHHNALRELHEDTWEDALKTLRVRSETEQEAYNSGLRELQSLRDGLAGKQKLWEEELSEYEEYGRRKSESVLSAYESAERASDSATDLLARDLEELRKFTDEAGRIKSAPSALLEPPPVHPGESPAEQAAALEAELDSLLKGLRATNTEAAELVDALRELGAGPPIEVQVGLSGEYLIQLAELQKKAEEELQDLKIKNIEDEFGQRREEAERDYDERSELAKSLAAEADSFKDRNAKLESQRTEENADEVDAAIRQNNVYRADLLAQSTALEVAAAEQLRIRLIQIHEDENRSKLSSDRKYLDRLKQLRVQAEETEAGEQRARAEQQLADDLDLAKEAGESETEIRRLAWVVYYQVMKAIRRSELQQELDDQREAQDMSLEQYIEFLEQKRIIALGNAEDLKIIDAELAEARSELRKEEMRGWEQLGNYISGQLTRGVREWLIDLGKNQDRVKEIWTEIGRSIRDAIIDKTLKKIMDYIAEWVIEVMAYLGKVLMRALAVKSVLGALGMGGIPSGDIIGPVASDLTAQTGAKVVQGGGAILHKDERVLSAGLTAIVEHMARLAKMPFPGAAIEPAMPLPVPYRAQEKTPAATGAESGSAPWDREGMTKEDWFTALAVEHVDPITVMSGGMLSIDEDSVDEFYEKTMIPAKKRYVEKLRDAVGEVIE